MSISPINMTTVNPSSPQDQSQGLSQPQASGQAQGTSQAQEMSQAQGASQTQGSEPSLKQVQHAVDQINNVVQTANTDVRFKVDHSSGRVVVQVMDTHNNEVLRQIPSK